MTTPIATLDDVKNFVGNLSSNTDTSLQMIVDSSLPAIGSYCNRNFTSTTVTEYRDGNNSTKMIMTQYPIMSVASVVIDGQVIPPSTPASVNAPASPGYQFVPGGRMIYLNGYRFNKGDRNVQITLTGGYGDASIPAVPPATSPTDIYPWPADLQMAFIMYCVTRLKERTRLGIGSQSLAGESVTYTDGPSGTSSGSKGIPAAAMNILNNYLNTVPETGQ